eukprot:TRINITY_DN5556_c0_g1_i1.p1 TRINITY_DN5556_c0_g1~~TRINITY_DN5556_c0_g1_i1.p1  ORF type:complete len:401 (+),score=60.20 TRINITY_DN5556_c0_g1_i1:151-1203(+)
MESSLQDRLRAGLGMLAKVAVPLAIGVASGAACQMMTGAKRLSLPVAPLSRSAELQQPIVDDGIYPPPFFIGNNRVCGAARCHPGDVCCPAAPGFGFACGASDAVCCQGNRGSIVCASNGQCCRNQHGASYCCASGNFCEADVCVAKEGTHCFPGHATVEVKGKGRRALRQLELGEEVLVSRSGGVLAFEPVHGYVHTLREPAAGYVSLEHTYGELRLSANHMLFVTSQDGTTATKVAGEVQVGDVMALSQDAAVARVLALQDTSDASDMYAPLTGSGTLIVDGVVASAYAATMHGSFSVQQQHAAFHASFFLARVYNSWAIKLRRWAWHAAGLLLWQAVCTGLGHIRAK